MQHAGCDFIRPRPRASHLVFNTTVKKIAQDFELQGGGQDGPDHYSNDWEEDIHRLEEASSCYGKPTFITTPRENGLP